MKFAEFCDYLLKLEKTTKRLEMFDTLSDMFSNIDNEEIAKAVYFIQEELLPPFYNVQLGIADKVAEKAIAEAYSVDVKGLSQEYSKKGDLGELAEKYNKKNTGSEVSLSHVYNKIFDITKITGDGSVELKIKSLATLIKEVSGLESKYIIRFVLGKLRLGVGEATIMEALSKSKTGDRKFKLELERAFNLCSDLGYVAEVFYKGGEEKIRRFKIEVMRPIRPALAERLPSVHEIVKKLGKFAVDQKFDGFRSQVHKDGDKVKIFSRNLEDITHFMPEVAEAVKKLKHKRFIFDSEALTYDENTNMLYPFQITMQRKRKHGVEEKAQSLPLRLFVFDIMLLDDKDLINEPFIKRREILDKLFEENSSLARTKMIITDSESEMTKFFDDTVSNGLEGVVAKKLDAPYSAGARNFGWIKLKRSYGAALEDTIDVVILGYYRGKGIRASFGLGGLLVGVFDEKADTFKTITKLGSGFSEEQFKELKRILDDIRVEHKPARVDSILQPDIWVSPKYVLTLKADEITRSPTHTAGLENGTGYALRFPRAVSFIRKDKRAEDCNTVRDIIEMFKDQKSVKLKN